MRHRASLLHCLVGVPFKTRRASSRCFSSGCNFLRSSRARSSAVFSALCLLSAKMSDCFFCTIVSKAMPSKGSVIMMQENYPLILLSAELVEQACQHFSSGLQLEQATYAQLSDRRH